MSNLILVARPHTQAALWPWLGDWMPKSQGQHREEVLKVGGALAMWEEPLLVGHYSCCCGQSQEGGHAHEFKESPNWWQVSFPECGDKRLGRDILRKSVQSRICSRKVLIFMDSMKSCFLSAFKIQFIPMIQALTARSDLHGVFPLHTKSGRKKHTYSILSFSFKKQMAIFKIRHKFQLTCKAFRANDKKCFSFTCRTVNRWTGKQVLSVFV